MSLKIGNKELDLYPLAIPQTQDSIDYTIKFNIEKSFSEEESMEIINSMLEISRGGEGKLEEILEKAGFGGIIKVWCTKSEAREFLELMNEGRTDGYVPINPIVKFKNGVKGDYLLYLATENNRVKGTIKSIYADK